MRILRYCVRVPVVLLAAWNIAFSWGKTGHAIINGNFEKFLPPAMQSLTAKSAFYVQHASDADNRKSADPSESPKHFIDIDVYPEFAAGTLTHDLDSLSLEYGSSTVTKNGLLPWAISRSYDSLVIYMSEKDWQNVDRVIADLGHYIGDAFQPLHCTQNYDGAMTGNRGIHSRFESNLLDDYRGTIVIDSVRIGRIDTTALEYAFRIIAGSNSRVKTILEADDYAKGVDANYGSAYYTALWSRLDTLMNEQLSGASEALASLVYSAWLDAGSPSLTTGVPATVPEIFQISSVYPNPFNPAANIDITLPRNAGSATAVVSVYSSIGMFVKEIHSGLSAGHNLIRLDLGRYSAGIYFVAVEVNGSEIHAKYLMKGVLLK